MAGNSVVINTEIKIDKAKDSIKKLTKELEILREKKKQYDKEAAFAKENNMNLAGTMYQTFDEKYSDVVNAIERTQESLYAEKENLIELKNASKNASKALQQIDDAQKQTAESANNASNELKQVDDAQKQTAKSANSNSKAQRSSAKSFKYALRLFVQYVVGVRSFYYLVRRLRTALVDGFKNLAQFNNGLNPVNTALSRLTSSLTQTKNSFATAFAPILTAIEPLLNRLIAGMNKAVTAIGMFFQAFQGNTFIKATAIQQDYAKSLNSTASSAKKAKSALASFDELNVLNKNEDSGSSSSSTNPNDMFEEVEIPSKLMDAVNKIKEALTDIMPLVVTIGSVLAGWSIAKVLGHFGKIGSALAVVAGLVLAIYNYFKMWQDGVSWKGIAGYIGGVALAVTGLYQLFGPVVAGIALIVAGIAGVVLALKDMYENGVNCQNIVLLLASAVGIVIGVFMAFGAPAAAVVAGILAIVGIIGSLIAIGGNGKEVIDNLKDAFKSFVDATKKLLKGDFSGALSSAKEGLKSFANAGIAACEGVANGFIKLANTAIEAINGILPDAIPDWVPLIGGKSFPKIPTISKEVHFPRLATGTVVPRQAQEFMAILGDNNKETEVVSPLSTMKQAMMEALAEQGFGRTNGDVYISAEGDMDAIIRLFKFKLDNEGKRVGRTFEVTT